jgi:hypothetical protein
MFSATIADYPLEDPQAKAAGAAYGVGRLASP